MMKISYYAYTNKGGRPNNEDSIRCGLQNRRGVFVLADGLGGHSSGEVASGLAAQAIWEGCAGAEILDSETLKGQLEEANRLVLEGQKVPGREDMKTTAVALALEGDLAFWAHVGDSRLYRFSDGQLVFATRDHSVTYMKYLGGEISYMDVYHDDDRSSLLRVLGKASCQPETGQAELKPGGCVPPVFRRFLGVRLPGRNTGGSFKGGDARPVGSADAAAADSPDAAWK